ncbi:helix-turn-helix domain-containing protein [Flavobacterium sp. N3904]|uniref:helix-turn-helix domain-containing protein n=1 Tax=Flavobacterium sp. N3904 TaxID=2986835 RepID=UPI00222597C8|nr:AraC family transcriptional regulator [Flavobacterium sp. N3904]
MKIYIKNMVCDRCIMAVRSEFEKSGIHPLAIELGQVELLNEWDEKNKLLLKKRLEELGFEIVEDKIRITVEKIKSLIIALVHHQNLGLKVNLSSYLAQNLAQDYNTLSNLFSEVEGVTIEHFFIKQKIEKVKELLTYNELSLSEIAYKMNYSDVAHLSNQFKKITGITPTKFKLLDKNKRTQIDHL